MPRPVRTDLHQPADGVWTYEEYMKLPVENTRYEIIAGDLYITPTPPVLHQVVLRDLLTEMYRWAEDDHQLGFFFPGPIDVLFGQGDFIEPDVVFVQRDRKEIVTDRAIEGVPDLIVEIVAPETAERDRGLKRDRYIHFGVPEYWVVDAEVRTVEIYRTDDPNPTRPRVVTDRWTWQPIPGGPSLDLIYQPYWKTTMKPKLCSERMQRRTPNRDAEWI
jgi:Uma2 family endonuclease